MQFGQQKRTKATIVTARGAVATSLHQRIEKARGHRLRDFGAVSATPEIEEDGIPVAQAQLQQALPCRRGVHSRFVLVECID